MFEQTLCSPYLSNMSAKLIAGSAQLEEFCIDVFSIPDPIIVIWTTEQKPEFKQEEETSDSKVKLVDDISIFFKEHINSLFFPNGFVLNEWNRVLVSVKESEIYAKYSTRDGMLCGWMMGTDIASQLFVNGKILVKVP